jgi:hypothetical protein
VIVCLSRPLCEDEISETQKIGRDVFVVEKKADE